jgi:hypothetical protein
MICMWFIGINCYKLSVEKDRDSIFTTITVIWKPGYAVQLPDSYVGYLVVPFCSYEMMLMHFLLKPILVLVPQHGPPQ